MELHPEQAGEGGAGPAGGGSLAGLDHGDGADAGLAAGEQGGKGDELGADDDGPAERNAMLQMHHRLQRAGVQDAERPVAGDQAGGAGGFARAGRQHHAARGQAIGAFRGRHDRERAALAQRHH